ncbi:MAG: hypothetical protein KC588_08340 [Nitrospira sp.]|nr:hypothetical protein [Nitrospira sp.]
MSLAISMLKTLLSQEDGASSVICSSCSCRNLFSRLSGASA